MKKDVPANHPISVVVEILRAYGIKNACVPRRVFDNEHTIIEGGLNPALEGAFYAEKDGDGYARADVEFKRRERALREELKRVGKITGRKF